MPETSRRPAGSPTGGQFAPRSGSQPDTSLDDHGGAAGATIERSEGVVVGVGMVVGGGGRAADPALDARVVDAAEVMARWVGEGGKVQIRFNSDRRSGGAWLVTAERDSVASNNEVGVIDDGDGLRLRVRRWATKNPADWDGDEDYAGAVSIPVGTGDLAGALSDVVGSAAAVQAKVDARSAEMAAYGDRLAAFLSHPRVSGRWTDRDVDKAAPLTEADQVQPGVWMVNEHSPGTTVRVIGPGQDRPGSVQVAVRAEFGRLRVESRDVEQLVSGRTPFKVIAGNDVAPPEPLSFDPLR